MDGRQPIDLANLFCSNWRVTFLSKWTRIPEPIMTGTSRFDWNWTVILSSYLTFNFEFKIDHSLKNLWPYIFEWRYGTVHFRELLLGLFLTVQLNSFIRPVHINKGQKQEIKIQTTSKLKIPRSGGLLAHLNYFFIVRTALIVQTTLHRCPESPDRWTGENCRGLSVWQMVVF